MRTLSWDVVCPSTGATGSVGGATATVGDGSGVCVGGNVAVITNICVGEGIEAGVAGRIISGLHAVLKSKTNMIRKNAKLRSGVFFISLLYPDFIAFDKSGFAYIILIASFCNKDYIQEQCSVATDFTSQRGALE